MFALLALITAAIGCIPLVLFPRHRLIIPWFGIPAFLLSWLVYYVGVPSLVWPLYGGVGGVVLALWCIAAIIASGIDNEFCARVAGFPALLALLFMVRCGSGFGMFRAAEYTALLGNVQEREWAGDVQPASPEHVRLVSEELALYLAKKQLGEAEGAIGSQFNIASEHATLQRINGELWYIFPLDFKDFGVWSSADGAPGYVKVHGEDPLRQPIVVSSERFVYTPGAYFSANLERHLWLNGYAQLGLTDYLLEIDDNGKAWWVVTIFKPTIAFSGPVVEGIVIVDPATGVSTRHDMTAAVPVWVDRVIPREVIMEYIAYRGKFSRGWLNSKWAERDVTKPDQPDIVYGSDGEPYWVTGITSANSRDDSLVAVMYTSARNGRSVSYKAVGGTDAAAIEAVNNAVAYRKWHGGGSILYNIYGTMAAIIPLQGMSHTFQGIGIVNIQTMQVAIGENASSAFREYQKLLAGAGGKLSPDIARQQREISGTVARFAASSPSGEEGAVYHLVIDGQRHIFIGSGELSPTLPVTRPGDTVRVTYVASDEHVVPLLAFDNPSVFGQEPPAETPPVLAEPKPQETQQ